jgi:hypothetical protein
MIKSLFKKVLDRFPKIAQLYRNGRDLLDRNQPSLITPWGFTLAGNSEMASGNFADADTLMESKQLMRFLLSLHLQDQVLTTRQILIDLKKI